MSRRAFIESFGATCPNWTWSWSFVNHAERFVIFGAWDTQTDGGAVTILADEWRRHPKTRRRQPAYGVALEHIRLIGQELAEAVNRLPGRKIFNTCCFMQHLMEVLAPDNHWHQRLHSPIRHHGINEASMGFPEGWRDSVLWRGA